MKVTTEDYQKLVREVALYRESASKAVHGLPIEALIKLLRVFYATTGLAGEAGEVSNKIKKILRDNEGQIDEVVRMKILGELGGVMWYITALAQEFSLSLEDIMTYNHDQLVSRAERGKLQGSGDDR